MKSKTPATTETVAGRPRPPVLGFEKRKKLPKPSIAHGLPLEECLQRRRSLRDYTGAPVTLAEAGQLLWAAQGVTGLGGLRTAPSAGAVYPIRTYLIAGDITGLKSGLYRYDPFEHGLIVHGGGDLRDLLCEAALGQECVRGCAGSIALAAQFSRVLREFGEKGPALALMEAGHIGQNICLQATSLELGAIGLAKFDPAILKELLALPAREDPVYLIAFGRPEPQTGRFH